MKIFFSYYCLVNLFINSVQANTFETLTHIDKQTELSCENNCDKTIESTTKRAKQGEALAQYQLGLMFFSGSTIKQNIGESVKWFLQAAEQGYEPAQDQLYHIYSSQKKKNLNKKLVDQLQRATKKGQVSALHTLGWIYLYGYGVKQKIETAVYWFQKAAKLDYVFSQYELGVALEQFGMEQGKNGHEAVKWFQKAAEKGYAPALYQLGERYSFYIGDMTKNKAKQDFFREAAKKGYALAQYRLGWMYFSGIGIKRDLKKSKYWLQKSAEQGHVSSQDLLSEIKNEFFRKKKCENSFK